MAGEGHASLKHLATVMEARADKPTLASHFSPPVLRLYSLLASRVSPYRWCALRLPPSRVCSHPASNSGQTVQSNLNVGRVTRDLMQRNFLPTKMDRVLLMGFFNDGNWKLSQIYYCENKLALMEAFVRLHLQELWFLEHPLKLCKFNRLAMIRHAIIIVSHF